MTSRLQRRLENELAEIETAAALELKALGESLKGVGQNTLGTIEADAAAWIERVRGMLLRTWLCSPIRAGKKPTSTRFCRHVSLHAATRIL